MLKFIKLYYNTFIEHLCFTRACALTFNTLLTIVPLFITIFEILKLLPWFNQSYIKWQKIIINQLSIENSAAVTDALNNLIQQHQHIPIITLLFLLITSSLMIRSIEESLNDIFDIHRRTRRNIFLSIFIYVLVLIIIPCVAGLLIYIGNYVKMHEFTYNISSSSFLETLIFSNEYMQIIFSYLIQILILFILYSTLTKKKLRISHKLIASFLVIFLLKVLKYLFILYLQMVPTYRILYGALASIPIFFLWIYLCWLCFLGGAILMQTLNLQHEEAKT